MLTKASFIFYSKSIIILKYYPFEYILQFIPVITKMLIIKNKKVGRLAMYFLAKHTFFNICFIYNLNKSFVFSLKSFTDICEMIIILMQCYFLSLICIMVSKISKTQFSRPIQTIIFKQSCKTSTDPRAFPLLKRHSHQPLRGPLPLQASYKTL